MQLTGFGGEVVLDDRGGSFGQRMRDVELIGFPYVVVVGKKILPHIFLYGKKHMKHGV